MLSDPSFRGAIIQNPSLLFKQVFSQFNVGGGKRVAYEVSTYQMHVNYIGVENTEIMYRCDYSLFDYYT